MAKITYKNGSIELDSEIVNLLKDKDTSDKIVDIINNLVGSEKLRIEIEKTNQKRSETNKSLGQNIENMIHDGCQTIINFNKQNVEDSVDMNDFDEDYRSDDEVEKDVKNNFTFGKEEIPVDLDKLEKKLGL